MTKIIFDLDGTLTYDETLPLIAKHFCIEEEILKLTKHTIQGNIPFVESFIKRVHMLKDLSVTEISDLLCEVQVHQKVQDFIREQSGNCAIATGNLDCWIGGLIKKFNCEQFSSNAEVKNDKVYKISKILRKEVVVEYYQKKGYKVVFVGDGNNDQEAMRIADISIASGLTHYPAKSILEIADYSVFSEEALCRLLKQLL